MFKTGHIYLFRPCRVSDPAKDKFAVCVSSKNNLFYLINSVGKSPEFGTPPPPYEYQLKTDRVVYLVPMDINSTRNVLSHKSFVDVIAVRIISKNDFDSCSNLGIISPAKWISIKKMAVQKLPPKYGNLIATEKIEQ